MSNKTLLEILSQTSNKTLLKIPSQKSNKTLMKIPSQTSNNTLLMSMNHKLLQMSTKTLLMSIKPLDGGVLKHYWWVLTLSLPLWHHMMFLTMSFVSAGKTWYDDLLAFWLLVHTQENQSWTEWTFVDGWIPSVKLFFEETASAAQILWQWKG